MKSFAQHLFCLLLFVGSSLLSQAQNFTYKSPIPKTNQSGFYKIVLGTALAARADLHYADLRIMDDAGKEIPYLYHVEEETQTEEFTAYPFRSEDQTKGVQTFFIENRKTEELDHWDVKMMNAEANRTLRISGSDDKLKYFVVRDSVNFSLIGSASQSGAYYRLSFPKTKYRYYKLEIRNGSNNPLNVVQIGFIQNKEVKPGYGVISGLRYERKDSAKTTILRCSCSPANRISALQFYISSPERFHRKVVLQAPFEIEANLSSISSAKKRLQTNALQSFDLSSDAPLFIETNFGIAQQKCKNFELLIQNNDNEVLQIDSIKAFQKLAYVVAELKSDHHYFLYYGDSLLQAPQYDLNYFEQHIKKDIPTIQCNEVLNKSTKQVDEFDGRNDQILVWIGLGLVALILLFIIRSMMKKMTP